MTSGWLPLASVQLLRIALFRSFLKIEFSAIMFFAARIALARPLIFPRPGTANVSDVIAVSVMPWMITSLMIGLVIFVLAL